MHSNGRTLDEKIIKKICLLLASTDMSITAIAKRMGVSPSVVTELNSRFRIRNYAGKKATWTIVASGRREGCGYGPV